MRWAHNIQRRLFITLFRWKIHWRHFSLFSPNPDEDIKRRVWHKKPFSVLLAYAFLSQLWHWEYHIPSPGYAVTALAVAAAIMSVLGEMGGREKVMWVLLLFGFLRLELMSIDMERGASESLREQSRAQEAKAFDEIGEGVKEQSRESQRQFEKTMVGVNRVFRNTGESLKQITGNGQFCYLVAKEFPETNHHRLNFVAINSGPRPLPECRFIIHVAKARDSRELKAVIKDWNVGLLRSNKITGPDGYPGVSIEPDHSLEGLPNGLYRVEILTRNDYFVELLNIDREKYGYKMSNIEVRDSKNTVVYQADKQPF